MTEVEAASQTSRVTQTMTSDDWRILHKGLRRELARRSLTDFSRSVFGFEPAKHHLRWIELLEDETVQRLLIIAPPESAKSTYISVIFPSWYIGRHVRNACALISCTATQAEEFGGAITRTIETNPEYHATFPEVLPDKDAGWSKTHVFVQRPNVARPDPTLMVTGMMGPIIGRRFNLVIIDDPTDQEIAYSELQRERQKLWFKQTLLSRLVKTGRCIVILTRWHEDDLAAELMKPEMGFRVEHLPAIIDGESYWPEHWPLDKLHGKRMEVGYSIFRCMYLGDPVDLSGNIFKREWFQYFVLDPEGGRAKIQIWDTALKATRKSDFNVCATGVLGENRKVYVTDIFRAQMEAPELEKAIVAQYQRHKPSIVYIEEKAAAAAVIQRLQREMVIPIKAIHPEKNKMLRARAVTPLFERGEVLFKAGAAWTEELEHELLAFPLGKYDDQVDALVYLILELQHGSPALVVTPARGIGMEGIRTKEF